MKISEMTAGQLKALAQGASKVCEERKSAREEELAARRRPHQTGVCRACGGQVVSCSRFVHRGDPTSQRIGAAPRGHEVTETWCSSCGILYKFPPKDIIDR